MRTVRSSGSGSGLRPNLWPLCSPGEGLCESCFGPWNPALVGPRIRNTEGGYPPKAGGMAWGQRLVKMTFSNDGSNDEEHNSVDYKNSGGVYPVGGVSGVSVCNLEASNYDPTSSQTTPTFCNRMRLGDFCTLSGSQGLLDHAWDRLSPCPVRLPGRSVGAVLGDKQPEWQKREHKAKPGKGLPLDQRPSGALLLDT